MSECHQIEISMASRVEYLSLLHTATSEVCQILDLDEDTAMSLSLAVHEAAVNAVKHGNRSDPNKKVKVLFTLCERELVLEVIDQGAGFEPDKVADPRKAGNIEKASGRGVFLMRSFVDSIEFHAVPGQGFTVSMVKKLNGASGGKTGDNEARSD